MQLSIHNRNDAFLQIVEKLPKKRKEVYNAISTLGKATLDNIAKYLKCRTNDISGRVTELKKCFLIKEVFSACSQRTGNSVTVYSICTEEERIDLVNERYVELTRKKDSITNDLNLNRQLSQASRRTLLLEIEKINKDIKALKKVI
jgi:hypothetical protein